jgi:hypothetical protein
MFNTGFGRYLTSIDPERRSWQWHLKNTIVLCTIHFARGISKAAGTERYPYSPHERMEALRTAPSKEKYMELCRLLIGMVFVICFKYICNTNIF